MSHPVYGRYQVAEAPSALAQLHLHDGSTVLKTSDHETPLGVLDQSDLIEQGIHCTHFIPGCKEDPDALGSCTANADAGEAAALLPEPEYLAFAKMLINHAASNAPTSYADVIGAERAAIAFYHRCSDQMGEPANEWPPTDCGSSGPYIYKLMKALGVISGQKITTAGSGLVSLLQGGGVLMGSPWFYSWEEPDAHGFVDGDGSVQAIQDAIASGLAGGHETRLAAVEAIAFLPTGQIDPFKTVIRDRNSWSKSWGDHGCCRFHLSTLMALNGQCDFRQFVR